MFKIDLDTYSPAVRGGFNDPDLGYSRNERAAQVMGPRIPEGKTVVPFDSPPELGYVCPVCDYEPTVNDERLQWSEYDSFLWCAVCDKDYPSVLCVQLDGSPDREWQYRGIDSAIDLFLDCIEDAKSGRYSVA